MGMLVLLLVTLTAAAQDVPLRNCRRGTPRTSGMLTRSAFMDDRQPGGDFYVGDRRQLVVLAAFRDRPFADAPDAALQQWGKVFNAEGYSEGSFVGSVHDYFLDQSYGLFNLAFDIYYVSLPDSCRKYRSTNIDDENSQFLVNDIVDDLLTRNIDWSLYDWNGDGRVNQLLIVYAGKGMNDGGGNNSIWPHQWWLSSHVNPATKQYCEPRSVSYGNRQYVVDCYCAVPERSGSSTATTFGTICHEYTHCFGFPDFYYGNTQYVGRWDLMDYGNYNGNGYCPAAYSAHERWLMGWLTPVELTSATTVSQMPSLSDQPQAYLIRNDGYADEYYIVENRQQTGWDAHLPGSGLVVFHVDFVPSLWTSVFEPVNHPTYVEEGTVYPAISRYTIFAASNQSSSGRASTWAYPYFGKDSLTNNSLPASTLIHANLDGTKLMSKPLTRMAVTDSLASFEFMQPSHTAVSAHRKPRGEGSVLYDFGPIRFVRLSDGTVRKTLK